MEGQMRERTGRRQILHRESHIDRNQKKKKRTNKV